MTNLSSLFAIRARYPSIWVLISRTILAEALKNIIREAEMFVHAPADYMKRLLYICQETIGT